MDKTGLSLCRSYCEVIGNSGLGLGFDFPIQTVHPATIEQGELLIKTMNEAGYVWDFEHKELKQIKRNTAWSEEDENILEDAITAIDLMLTYEFQESNPTLYRSFLIAKNWLKEKRIWKPTDEQIIALRWALNNIPYCNHKEEISRLLDQIKNL